MLCQCDDDDSMKEDPDLLLMSQEWKKIHRDRYNDGFRDGSAAGQNKSLQDAFNAGFKQGFFSSFILSKIRGILTALLAYQVSYEGHPITDAVVMESHSLLEEIDSLEANAVADEFLKLSLHQTPPQHCPDDIIEGLHSATIRQSSPGVPRSEIGSCQSSLPLGDDNIVPSLDVEAVNRLTVQQVNQRLMQCPPILNSVNRCKGILRSLNWSDEMIDGLL